MSEKIFVPPLKIQGIKTKLVPLIRENVILDKETIWYEPFMGSGVVGFNIEPERAVFADVNPHIINFYNRIKDGSITSGRVRAFLEAEGKKLENGDADYYYEVRDRFNQYHEPLDFLFLNRACFNGMMRFNKDYNFNVPYGHKPQRFAKAYITKIVNQVAHIEELLKNYEWEFLCQSFEDTISSATHSDFIYCDPPYIGRHVDYYDSWDEELEVALHSALVKSQSNFMLSTWHHNDYRSNEYIEQVWNDCQIITREHFYHVGAKEKNRNPVVEALLTNYVITGTQNQLRLEMNSCLYLALPIHFQKNSKLKTSCIAAKSIQDVLHFSKHHLHQQHIAQRAAGDGNQRLMPPLMERNGHADGDGLRDAVAARGEADALEAVDDEHSEDGGGQHMAQILHHLRYLAAPGAEHQKGQKTGEHGRRRADGDGQDELDLAHFAASLSLASMGRRNSSSAARMQTIEGMRKLPEPKMRRQTSGAAMPMMALACCFSFSHWLRKMTTNMAVMTKSTPSVLKGRTEPRAAPMAALATQ